MITRHCIECHGADSQEAQLNLEDLLSHDPLVRDREQWRRIIQLLEMEIMPPEHASSPLAVADRSYLLAELDRAITRFDYSNIDDPGAVPLRRMTHRQYDNTIRDLFGVDLKPAARFPTELTGSGGFDNSAATLFLQSTLMERYIAAAERVVAEALPAESVSDVHRHTRELIFESRLNALLSESDAATAVLRRFLLRAYRRPPSDDELGAITERYEQRRDAGQNFNAAVIHVLPQVLISPKFLMLTEQSHSDGMAHPISDYELASRLSYFLWASMPDIELFDLAQKHELHEPEILSAQVKRMVHDPKADSFGEAFAGQWLHTQLVGTRIRLDPIDYPWCTDSLMSAMRSETELFFMSLLRENRPLSELIDADYTFMNEELARALYRVDDVKGSHMRRVELDDPRRHGILGHPSVLAITSSNEDTSPVKRGIFVLETLLGTPPPPPPPDAGELDPELAEDDELTFREKLERHASNVTCRACHANMDPIGFALEHFDYFGRWRDTYAGKKAIESIGVMPDGAELAGSVGVRKWILDERREAFVRQVAGKMLAYALGRPLEYYDEPALRKIVHKVRQGDGRFQTLLLEVVTSYPFLYRKDSQGPTP